MRNPATLSGEVVTVGRESLGSDGSASLWLFYFEVVAHFRAVGHGGLLRVAKVFRSEQIGGLREKDRLVVERIFKEDSFKWRKKSRGVNGR